MGLIPILHRYGSFSYASAQQSCSTTDSELKFSHVQVHGSKGSISKLAVENSAIATPEVNLRNPFHAGNELCPEIGDSSFWCAIQIFKQQLIFKMRSCCGISIVLLHRICTVAFGIRHAAKGST